jgi:DNA-binding beta-propeller fold protein YncE
MKNAQDVSIYYILPINGGIPLGQPALETYQPIAIGPNNPTAIAVTPDGSRAYVTCDINVVYIIDTSTNSLISDLQSGNPITIPVGLSPSAIAISPINL